MTVNPIMSTDQTVSIMTKVNSGSDTSFQSILMTTSGQTDRAADQIQTKSTQSKSQDTATDTAVKDLDNTKEKVSSDTADSKVTETDKVTETSKDTETKAADEGKEDSEKTDAVNATQDETEVIADSDDETSKINQILSVIETILAKLSELLQMSQEELQSQLSDAGISVTQLTDKNVLQQLVLQLSNNSDASALLTDENLANSLQDIFQEINQILSDAGITADEFKDVVASDDFQEIMQQISEMMDSDDTTFQQALQSFKDLIQQNQQSTDPLEQQENPVNKESVITNDTVMSSKQQQDDVRSVNSNEAQALQEEAVVQNSKPEAGSSETSQGDSSSTFTSFVQQLVNAGQTQEANTTVQPASFQELTEIANQIIEQVKLTVSPEQTSMELQLNPESLGKVTLVVSSKEGVMTAQMMTQNQVAKEAIESQIGALYETLEQQGLKVDAIEVTVAGFGFDMNKETSDQQQRQQQSKKSGISFDEDGLSSSEDDTMTDLYLGDSTVNYVA